jgi:tight adherence protein C
MIIFIAGLVFGSVALIVGTLSWVYMRHRSNAAKIRRFGNEFKPEGTDSLNPDAMAEILERIARPLNKIAPPSVQDADKLQRLMLQAGYFSPRAPLVFRGIQLLGMGALPALTGLVLFLMEYSAGKVALGILISFALGFILPRYILGKMIAGRQQRLTWGLADALDLMVVSMEAGLGINAAMVKVSEELADARAEISERVCTRQHRDPHRTRKI